jgi:AcrR family transcriptional regulator
MTARTAASSRPRPALTRERVLRGAVDLADRIGVEALTIRRLADDLGVSPMTIYHHVPSKDAIVDGMVDLVFAQIDLPPRGEHWKSAARRRCVSARAVLNRHPWAPALMESRTNPGPATLRHHEEMLACFRRGGLTLQMTAHAGALLDSYVYGFALQEASLPFGGSEQIGDIAEQVIAAMPEGEYPTMVEFTRDHVLQPGYSFGASFEFGLDMLLDGLEAAGAG